MRIRQLTIPDDEIRFTAIRSQGAGGQNVNKVATGVQLQFDIRASSLPPGIKQRLLSAPDARVSKHGVLTIKSQETRSQSRNRQAALQRLHDFIESALAVRKRRRETVPTAASKRKRLEGKLRRGAVKRERRRPTADD